MRTSHFLTSASLALAGAALVALSGCGRGPNSAAITPPSKTIEVRFQGQSAGAQVYEGRIKDVRPAWGTLILTVGNGSEARDVRFDIGEARIVGPSGDECKGDDLRAGDLMRVELTADGKLVQQVSVLAN